MYDPNVYKCHPRCRAETKVCFHFMLAVLPKAIYITSETTIISFFFIKVIAYYLVSSQINSFKPEIIVKKQAFLEFEAVELIDSAPVWQDNILQ